MYENIFLWLKHEPINSIELMNMTHSHIYSTRKDEEVAFIDPKRETN